MCSQRKCVCFPTELTQHSGHSDRAERWAELETSIVNFALDGSVTLSCQLEQLRHTIRVENSGLSYHIT
jgi:hypothetical protein